MSLTGIASQDDLENFLLVLSPGERIRVVFSVNASPRIAQNAAQLVTSGVLVARPLDTAALFAVAREGTWEVASQSVVFWLGKCFEYGHQASRVVAAAIWEGVGSIEELKRS